MATDESDTTHDAASVLRDRAEKAEQRICEMIAEAARTHEASQKAYFEVDAAWHEKRKECHRLREIVAHVAEMADSRAPDIHAIRAFLKRAVQP